MRFLNIWLNILHFGIFCLLTPLNILEYLCNKGLFTLMKFFILIFTALSVSVDSFFCGLSLSVKTREKFKSVLIIATTVLFLCFLGANVGFLGSVLFKKYSSFLGGVILCLLAFKGCFIQKNNDVLLFKKDENATFIESFLVGFSIGIDGMIGAISLTVIGFNYILVALTITIVHVLLLIIAFNFPYFYFIKNQKNIQYFSSFLLLALGLIKLLSL